MAKINLELYVNRHSQAGKFKRLLWEIAWALFAKHTPRWCLNGWRCFLLRMFGATIGRRCRVYGGTQIWMPMNLVLGDDCWLDNDVKIYNVDKVVLGSNCVVSAGAFLCTASHDISSTRFELVTKPIELKDGAWCSSNALVLPGVTIGEGAVVGAGAVVTKDVEPWTVVAGNPARFVKKRELRECKSNGSC